jgi:hypothetical protein
VIKEAVTIQVFALCALLFPFAACAQSSTKTETVHSVSSARQSESCSISGAGREALLNLDYNSFDQSLPAGGWRQFQMCPLFTRALIDAYTERHSQILQKQQWDVLVWHSGQISAMAGDYADAIAKMGQTLKPNEKPTDGFLWNPYAKATIAFLKKDLPALVAERKNLDLALSPLSRINLRHVDAFIRCRESTYAVAYSETCVPSETNIQRIQSLAVPFALKVPFPKIFMGLPDFFGMKKVILVGEVHGTSEVPSLFANIAEALASDQSKTLVILEIPQSSQLSIDAFLKSGDELALQKEPFFNRAVQDGRSSKAMVVLLKKLSKLPNVTVLCMDPSGGAMTGQERDSGMAAFINAKRNGYDHTLVLAGNVHSSTALGAPWDKNYRPMGFELKAMAKDLGDNDLLNILVRYGTVTAWTCQGAGFGKCGVHNGKEILTEYSQALPVDSYFVWEGESVDGHNASVFVRSSKASFPFIKTPVAK